MCVFEKCSRNITIIRQILTIDPEHLLCSVDPKKSFNFRFVTFYLNSSLLSVMKTNLVSEMLIESLILLEMIPLIFLIKIATS